MGTNESQVLLGWVATLYLTRNPPSVTPKFVATLLSIISIQVANLSYRQLISVITIQVATLSYTQLCSYNLLYLSWQFTVVNYFQLYSSRQPQLPSVFSLMVATVSCTYIIWLIDVGYTNLGYFYLDNYSQCLSRQLLPEIAKFGATFYTYLGSYIQLYLARQ